MNALKKKKSYIISYPDTFDDVEFKMNCGLLWLSTMYHGMWE